jgi:chromosome segregation ATPase
VAAYVASAHYYDYRKLWCVLLLALQGQALQAEMQVTQLSEEVKLLTGRCSSATAHSTDVQQQLTAALSENAGLHKQLAEYEAREADAAAEAEQLQQSLLALQGDLRK